ncbi:Uncharacterised protein [Mycobacteroides abscessus]|nr:Uncharacterised protein [Mycobacteroides abscessus]
MGASARTRVHARPDRQDHWHALRVAAGLALPGALLLAAGRPELLVYSVFGSFTGIYGRGESGWPRTRHQIQAGLLLCAGVALGVTLSWLHTSAWMLVVVEVAFATAGSVIADVLRLRPAGPFFFIFAMGATATVPAGPVTPMTALGLCAGTALLSVLSAAPVRALRSHRRPNSPIGCHRMWARTRCGTHSRSRPRAGPDCCSALTMPIGPWPPPRYR